MANKFGKLSARYARALLSSVDGKKPKGKEKLTEAQQISEELNAFSEIWAKDKEISSLLVSPMYQKDQRKAALDAVLDEIKFSETTSGFISLLFERERIAALPEITALFSKLADDAASVVRVKITTARKVKADEVKEIEKSISSKLPGETHFFWSIEEDMLGGMKIEYSGKIIDGSLNGKLERFERQLAS